MGDVSKLAGQAVTVEVLIAIYDTVAIGVLRC